MKLFIIGAAGSGKTTLARIIGEHLSITPVNLDDLFWDNTLHSYGVRRNEVERNALLDDEINKESWIIEGVYVSWPIAAIKSADRILYLKTPGRTINFRIWSRFIKRKLGLEKRTKKETLNGVIELVKWNRNQIVEINSLLEKIGKGKRVDVVRNRRDAMITIQEIITS